MKVLVTGAGGFIGRTVCAQLSDVPAMELIGSVRPGGPAALSAASVVGKEIGPDTQWHDVLDSVEVVVHCAALAHRGRNEDSMDDYRQVNVAGTLNLAGQAAAAGVGRFVFLSSMRVHGDGTRPGHAFGLADAPAPMDAYSRSKHEAEVGLARLASEREMEVVIIRPPLVYGPGVKANFLRLMRWIQHGYPLPFAGVRNKRSFIAVHNLVELIRICCVHPLAANRTFLAADEEDLSTRELVARIAAALDRRARLVAVPPRLLVALATLAGKRSQAMTLLGNFQVDASEAREFLGWRPVVGMEQALESTARHFLEHAR